MATSITELVLSRLGNGLPGITPVVGATLVEACSVCLIHHNHIDHVQLNIDGSFSRAFVVRWSREKVTEQVLRCWNDLQDALEDAAACIACLLVIELTEFTIIERSRKGTGFDYWLGKDEDEPIFTRKGRLEVSGIMEGSEKDIRERTRQKLKQSNPSDNTLLPAYAIIVEFSRPLARVARK